MESVSTETTQVGGDPGVTSQPNTSACDDQVHNERLDNDGK